MGFGQQKQRGKGQGGGGPSMPFAASLSLLIDVFMILDIVPPRHSYIVSHAVRVLQCQV